MATKKLTDYLTFDPFSNPAGGLKVANTTPTVLSRGAAPAPTPALNRNVPSSLTPAPGIVLPPGSPLARPTGPSASPIITPSGGGPAAAPVGPQGATGDAPAAQSPVPPQWLNADGSFKTPDQVANDVGGSLAGAHGNSNSDMDTLTRNQLASDGKSVGQLEADTRRIGNARNDIAVGETDPYKVGSQSGIAYTPAELSAIEKAYSGIYDPALDTALGKVTDKQASDKAAAAAKAQANAPYTLGKDEVRYGADGQPIAVGLPSSTAGGGVYTKGANPVVDAYVDGVRNQTVKLADVPDAYKDLVVQGMSSGTPTLSKNATDALSNIQALLSDPKALDAVTGYSNINPLASLPGASEAPYRNLLNQLAGTLAVQSRGQLKGSGAISDFEFRILQQAASDLGVQPNGTSNLNPVDLKKSLEKLQLKLQVGETSLTDDELTHLKDQGYTPDQIRTYGQSQSFSSAGNASDSKTSLNRPQRNNNPGNVKEGGLADSLAVGKDDQGHLIFPDAQTGFKALTADLTAKINGGSSHLPANPTIEQLGKVYAEDPNWPKKVASILGVTPDTHTQMVPLANLVKAVATQEGFYA